MKVDFENIVHMSGGLYPRMLRLKSENGALNGLRSLAELAWLDVYTPNTMFFKPIRFSMFF
jgi:hypothetical protein